MKKIIFLATVIYLCAASMSFAILPQNWRLDAPQGDNTYTVTNKVKTAATVTLTIGAHTLKANDYISVALNPPDPRFDGSVPGTSFIISSVTATTISYARSNVAVGSVASGGTVTGPLWFVGNSNNRGLAYNDATGHILVPCSSPIRTKILNYDGTIVGDLKMKGTITNKQYVVAPTRKCIITVAETHGLQVGQYAIVVLSPADANYDGTYVISEVTANTITYAKDNGASALPSTAATGTLNNVGGETSTNNKIMACKGEIFAVPVSIAPRSNGADVFKIYHWNSESTIPNIIFKNNQAGGMTPLTVTGAIGPQTPACGTVTNKALTSNVATLTLSGPPAVGIGHTVSVQLSPADAVFDGATYTITAVSNTAPYTISYARTNANVASTTSGGTISATAYRVGDTMDVVDDNSATPNFQIYTAICQQGSGAPSKSFYRFSFQSGAAAVSTVNEVVLLSTVTNNAALTGGGIAVDGYGGKVYRASSVEFASWDNDGSNYKLAGSNIRNPIGIQKVATIGSAKIIGFGSEMGFSGSNKQYNRGGIIEVDTANDYKMGFVEFGPNRANYTFANTSGYGSFAFDDQTARTGRCFILNTNNTLGSYTMPASAETRQFTGSGNWNEPANWTPSGVPSGFDTIEIPAGKDVEIAGPYSAVCKTLTIKSGASVRVSSVGQTGWTPEQTTGYGLNDITVGGSFTLPTENTGNLNPRFIILIGTGGTVFSWNNDDSATYTDVNFRKSGTNVPITAGVPIALTQGITVTFGSSTYTAGDIFKFRLIGNDEALFIGGDHVDATNDLIVEGTLKNYCNLYNPVNTINNFGRGNKTLVKNGGSYEHGTNYAFSAPFPTSGNGAATFEASSNFILDIMGGNVPAISGRTFGNFILQNSYYTAIPALPCIYTGTGTGGLTIQGNYIVNRGAVAQPALTGTYTFNGNIVNNSTSGSPETAQPVLIGDAAAGGAITFAGDTTISSSVASSVQLRIATTKAVTVNATRALRIGPGGNLQINCVNAGSANINVNGILELQDNCALSNVSSPNLINLNINSGASLKTKWTSSDPIGDPFNLPSPNALAGVLTFNPAANYFFNGIAPQVTGATLPADAIITIDNPSGVTLSYNTTASIINLTNGEFNTTGKVIVVPDGNTTPRTNGFINGPLTKTFISTTTGVRTFPIGTTGKYTPVEVNLAWGSSTGNITAASFDGDYFNVQNTSRSIKRSWTVSSSIASISASLAFTYLDSDITSGFSESSATACKYTGVYPFWTPFNSSTTINAASNKATVSSITGFSRWALFETSPVVNTSTPDGTDFGVIPAGSSGAPKAIHVTNTGLDSLSISIAKTGSADITGSPSSFSVPMGGSQDITINYAPTSAGAKTATFSLTHNDPAQSSPIDVIFTGSAYQVTSSPEPLDFGYVKTSGAGGLGKTMNLSIINTSPANVSYTLGIATPGVFSSSSPTVFVNANTTGTIAVNYLPTGIADDSSAFTLTSSNPAAAQNISGTMTGRGFIKTQGIKAVVNGTTGGTFNVGTDETPTYTSTRVIIPAGSFAGNANLVIQEPADNKGKANCVEVTLKDTVSGNPVALSSPATLFVEFQGSDLDSGPANQPAYMVVAKYGTSWTAQTAGTFNDLGGGKYETSTGVSTFSLYATINSKSEIKDWTLLK